MQYTGNSCEVLAPVAPK